MGSARRWAIAEAYAAEKAMAVLLDVDEADLRNMAEALPTRVSPIECDGWQTATV